MPSAKCGGFRNQEVGKFLVQRRDGTVPSWTWFVLGARDPHAPAALRAYADSVMKSAPTAEQASYADDVRALATAFEAERIYSGSGDPEKGPHRRDDPRIIALMQPGIVEPTKTPCGLGEQPAQVWSGTAWVRNPALPPPPEAPAPVPIPGFRGGSFVPADVRTVNPTPAITTAPPVAFPTAQSSPTRPYSPTPMVPVMPVAAFNPLVQSPTAPVPGLGNTPVPGQAALAYAAEMNRLAAAETMREEGMRRLIEAPPPSRAVAEPAPQPPPPAPLDPIAEQIARARAAASTGKL